MSDVSRAYPVHHEKEKKRTRKREGRASAPDPAAVGSVVENSSGARLPEWNRGPVFFNMCKGKNLLLKILFKHQAQ